MDTAHNQCGNKSYKTCTWQTLGINPFTSNILFFHKLKMVTIGYRGIVLIISNNEDRSGMIRSKGVTFRSGGEVKRVKGVHKIEELGHTGVLEKISCDLTGELKFAMLFYY